MATRKPRYTHRIRRCDGNREAWLLVALNDAGEEMHAHGSYTTALSIDALLRHSGGLLPQPGDVVEITRERDDTPECNCGTCTPPHFTCIRED